MKLFNHRNIFVKIAPIVLMASSFAYKSLLYATPLVPSEKGIEITIQKALLTLENAEAQDQGIPKLKGLNAYNSLTRTFFHNDRGQDTKLIFDRAVEFIQKNAKAGFKTSASLTYAGNVLGRFQKTIKDMESVHNTKDGNEIYRLRFTPEGQNTLTALKKIKSDLALALKQVRETQFYFVEKKQARDVLLNKVKRNVNNTIVEQEMGVGPWVEKIINGILEANSTETPPFHPPHHEQLNRNTRD